MLSHGGIGGRSGPYFRYLSEETSLDTYFRGGPLGRPRMRMVYWQGQPAAHWSVFPFPLWIDEKPVIGGDPEAAAVHPKVAVQFPRPDLFGLVMDELIEEVRDSGCPLLVALTHSVSRKSYNRRGFVDVSMPAVDFLWPLHAGRCVAHISANSSERLGRIHKLVSNKGGRTALSLGMTGLGFVSRLAGTLAGSRYQLEIVPVDELSDHTSVIERNYWTEKRVTIWRNVDYLKNLFRFTDRYEVLKVTSRKGQNFEAVIFINQEDGQYRVLDILPPHLSLQTGLWTELLRFARGRGAHSVLARFYLNNPAQTATAHRLRWRLPTIMRSTEVAYSVLALDPEMEFSYDSQAWAGTDMLLASF